MKIALISGASRGIGLEFAKLLDDDVTIDELWLICGKNTPCYEFKKPVKIFHTDLSERSPFKELKYALYAENPCIRYLICSAGVGFNGKVENISEENIQDMVMINCSSLSILTKICLPYIKNGKIIEIASSAGFSPQPDFAVYAATKSYVISFSRALGRELHNSKRKISVTAVCPGPVDTDFFSGLENVKEYKKKHVISPEKVAEGALKASLRRKKVYTPTFSMKMVHLASKIFPTNWILKFYK